MARKLNKILRILTVTAFCAIASIFLFTGCTNKSAKLESPDASEYGLYTNLTLSIDSGDGKVWATVKNTFTFMPSSVRVSVELYKSATYKEDYTSMELASENTVADLNIGKTLLTEASTNGEKAYWQARMFYKIDEKEWQEQTTKLWLIDGNGKFITQYVTPPAEETNIELPDGTLTLKDLFNGEPYRAYYQMPYFYEFENSFESSVDGSVMDGCWGTKNKDTEAAEDISGLYGILSSLTFEFTDNPPIMLDYYCIKYWFNSGEVLEIHFRSNGAVGGWYINNNADKFVGFITDIGIDGFDSVSKHIEDLIISSEG